VVLKDVADRLREKQNASKRAAAAAGRKDGRDVDGMEVDEPGGSGAGKGGRKYGGPFSLRFASKTLISLS